MEVRRLSSKRLAAPTFFVRRSPELTLPLKTNNRPWYDALSGGCVGREAGRKQKTQSSKTTFHHKRIHRKQKAAPTDGFMKIIWRKLVFLTIYPYICNRLFELCKALYITVEDRSLNRNLQHFIIH